VLFFWLIAGGMTLAAVGFVAARLVAPPRVPLHVEPREANLAALRAAWAELDRDCAAGLLPRDQRESARAELAGRAAEELDEGAAITASRPAWIAAAMAAVLIPLAALGVYRLVGNPGSIDTARAFAGIEDRLGERSLPAFRDRLAAHLADNPRDGRAWAILGRVDLALERYGESAAAFSRAIDASPKVAGDAEIWVDYAEAVGMAGGRTLVGRPAQLIARALAIDPANARAREMAGSLATERGDPAGAALHWKLALDRLEAGDPRRDDLARAIARAERLAHAGGMTKP
jgi:cytochrome c-type biogenesis protein CcmH